MRLPIRIRNDARGQFVASCEALPGCSARAESYEQAVDRLEQAIHGYLASLNVATPKDLKPHLTLA
jgi:predicted RNase H-like HicB family nuclease